MSVCPFCGTRISAHTAVCPTCDAKKWGRTSWLLTLIFGFALPGLIALVCLGGYFLFESRPMLAGAVLFGLPPAFTFRLVLAGPHWVQQ
jgi:hypothetical protein